METPVQAHVTYLFSKFLLIVEEKHEIVVYNNAFRNDAIMPFGNLQSRVRTHAILVIGLYELLGNPTT
jgi:hypothetical protein